MAISSIHNILAKLDSTFKSDSKDTNFYQLLQVVAHELDSARRELDFTKRDDYFYQVRDDQLYNNLGVLLKINKQPFFTKREILTQNVQIRIEEDFRSKPKCESEHLLQIIVEWDSELESTTEVDYTERSPFIVPKFPDPESGIFDIVNEQKLLTSTGNRGKHHKAIIPARHFGAKLFFRTRHTNVVGETRQSDFIEIDLPTYPLVAPKVSSFSPVAKDSVGNTLLTPLDSDPYGFRQYRKILYGVLKSYLTGPTLDGVRYSVEPFFDFPVEIVENFPGIQDLYVTNAIIPTEEILVHTFRVSVLLNDQGNLRNLGELNQQVQEVLQYTKPAHTLVKFQYVIPDHFFCPTDNPYGVKQKPLGLEPTVGPCGEKVYINPAPIDLGAYAYYEDVLGYRSYCETTSQYFGLYCPYKPYEYVSSATLHSYYDVVDRNYFYIDRGKRLVICPFVKDRKIELHLEHRNDIDPVSVIIEGDVELAINTFTSIPFAQKINVELTSGNGPKTVKVKFVYTDVLETSNKNRALEDTTLGPGCHGTIEVDAVTYLLNTLPEECCAEQYIESEATLRHELLAEECDVLQGHDVFVLGDEGSLLSGIKVLGWTQLDDVTADDGDHYFLLSVDTRTTSDSEIVLYDFESKNPASLIMDMLAEDSLEGKHLQTWDKGLDECIVLDEAPMIDCDDVYLTDRGVIVEMFHYKEAFMTYDFEPYNEEYPDFNLSLLSDPDGPVISPLDRFDLEPWNRRLTSKSDCPEIELCLGA